MAFRRRQGVGGASIARFAALALGAAFPLGGCDPVVSIEGAFFPAWILCIAGGLVLAAVAHRLLVASGLQPHVGPLALVYPATALFATNLLWLLFFQT
jgi:YtcA family